jgi:hypothetical protein
VLVPLATTIILAKLVGTLANRTGLESYPTLWRPVCWTILGVVFTGGVAISFFGLGYRTNADEIPMLEFVRLSREKSRAPRSRLAPVYLLPVDLPKLDSGRGAASTNFTPAPRAGKSGHLIAIDLQRFRIFTGAPIYVDFKSIPYSDTDVVKWHEQLLWTRKLYTDEKWNDLQTLEALARARISHVIATGGKEINGTYWKKVYENPENPNYRIYRMNYVLPAKGVGKEWKHRK